ncbi:hypothetical protein ASZ90_010722 [hydrocarbon metagenome]|uniref:Uncharacterized protein n=1 Tax=hydrocarbon metagenome TaxID=938273 RepID=A0A0W8FF56_9ZZZZ
MQQIDPEQQRAMMDRVDEIIKGTRSYDALRKELHNMGFTAKEDRPGLAIWENLKYEIFVLIRMSPGGERETHQVLTFEEMEGFE